MAQTKIWNANNAYKVVWYITQDKKVRPSPGSPIRYVTAIGCGGEEEHFARDVAEQFQKVKERFGKTDGVQVYHAEQSFLTGEVTAQEAHEIGVAMAKELWSGFQVVVATHLDTGTIHNHFCLNSVSQLDGHKFHDCLESYAHMREVSDRLCYERGLSTIESPSKDGHKNYRTWLREKEGQQNTTVRSWIREDIDKLLPEVSSVGELLQRMESLGYAVVTSGKYVKVRPLGRERFFRLSKLGKGYSEEDLHDKLHGGPIKAQRQYIETQSFPTVHAERRTQTIQYLSLRVTLRPHSVSRRYLTLRHLAKMLSGGRYPSRYPSPGLREAARDLERFSEKTYLLCRGNIHTLEDLSAYEKALDEKITALTDSRQALRSKLAVAKTSDEQAQVRKEISGATAEIKEMYRQKKLCQEISQEAETISKLNQREFQQMKREQAMAQQKIERTDENV